MDLVAPTRGVGLAEQAYAALRDAVLTHQMPPGTRLSVPEIAQRLNISRSPAREAIARIVSDGLAINEPNRGAVVASVDLEQLAEIYALREVLEGLACRLAASAVTDDGLRELRELLDNHARAVASGDTERHYEFDQQFHAQIRHLAGNRRLSESLERLRGQIRVAMYTTRRSTGGMPQAIAEHHLILEALESRQPIQAEKAGRQHIARLLQELQVANVREAGTK